jgi:hypothetical protein
VSVSRTDGAQTAPTAFRQRPPPPCSRPRPHRHYFPTHRFPTATPPSSTASRAIKGAHPHCGAPFLPPLPFAPHYATIPAAAEPPWTARSSLSPTNSTTPRAPRHCVQPPRTVSCRPPPPDAAPTAVPLRPTTPRHRTCSSGELFLPAALKWVHHPTTLLPGPSPLHLVTGHHRNPAGPPPAPPWPSAHPCIAEMGHQPKWLGQSEAGRPVSARLHSAACHFSMQLKID